MKKEEKRPKAQAAARGPENQEPKHAAPPRQSIELNHIQELVCDMVGDMLLHGGTKDAVNSILYGAMEHYVRRTFSAFGDPIDANTRVDTFIRQNHREWETELMVAWKQNQAAPKETRPEPKTVTERVREAVREELEGRLEDFMRLASPEETRLLRDVLVDWDSNATGAANGWAEVFLATAFMYQVGENARYVRVPYEMIGKVEKYIEALKAIERPAAA